MQMKALHHGAIVPILEEPAQCEHHRFFVMPWFAGGDLERAVAAGELAVAEALEAVARALEGLAHAHESGLVHRDVKPSNILLDERGRGLIADFDLVRADDTTRGTRTNAGMGSLRWAAPEQLNDAREADARADVYGAALCVLYVLKRVVPPVFVTLTEPRYLDDLGCSRGLRDALRGALAYDPDARTTTCALLVAAIRANTHDDDPEGEKPAWATAAGSDGYGMWASFRVGEVEQRMRWIEPGTFMMGSPSDEPGWLDREGPQHEVTLTQGYWMAETPCTQALWEAVMGANPSGFKSPARPVEGVSWDDVGRFLEQLEQRVPGLGVGLPTEAQWEYACRAGTETATYAGAIELLGGCHAPVLDEIAWYGGNSGVGFDLPNGYDSSDWSEKQYPHTRAGTRTVKQKRPNSWGLHDMLGNVWEWCLDGNRAYDVSPVSDPVGPDGPSRVYRGGGWHCDARRVRAANRGWNAPGFRYDYLGFRLVRGQKQRS
jgi:formylglycine-generating enzyme required for sulfatase activity